MKRKLLCVLPILLSVFCVLVPTVSAESSYAQRELFTAIDETGQALFTRFGPIAVGDEYISGDNTLYRIASVSGTQAQAKRIGKEPMPDVSFLEIGDSQPVFAPEVLPVSKKQTDNRKLIALYVTHSDESYVPTDGTESRNGRGGIYDVARSFKKDLENLGVEVILDESTHLPHDAGAYRRSRQTAERLLQKRPDAIIDVHRDGIPDESQYAKTIDGEKASRVRLLVGRSNQNSAVNREFAKEIKAVADKQYPGLVKDIFIGKGTYNQDLSPNAILLEFGTHTISKDRVLASTEPMAKVVSTALYGPQTGSAKSEKAAPASNGKKKDSGAASGIIALIVLVVVGIAVFAFAQTGTGKGAAAKIGRGVSEMTGGMLGKKPPKK